MYKVPKNFFFRLHHARPRFKNDLESVLLFFAAACSKLDTLSLNEYREKLNQEIKFYPNNNTKKDKTINNWRTEIAALFGFYIEDKKLQITKTGKQAFFLNKEQDLVQFFKFYLLKFQYPGGYIKPDRIKEIIHNGVKFKPAQYILKLLLEAKVYLNKTFGISKAEATHCIFNDLRVTRDSRKVEDVIDLIEKNREEKIKYDSRGDITRYAGDILDYMVCANLLYESHGYFYLNRVEMEAILSFISSEHWFDKYDAMYNSHFSCAEISALEQEWFDYVNEDLYPNLFKTDIAAYFPVKPETEGYSVAIDLKVKEILDGVGTTKDIGDLGESLIIGHEKVRLTRLGREDLIHLVKKIPTSLAVGYDIQSVEYNEVKRYIEVKTTISHKPLKFFNFHMTSNEWNTAQTLKDRYFIYRLMINKISKTIYILQDPVFLYKNDKIDMSPRNGAEISFKENVAEKTELFI